MAFNIRLIPYLTILAGGVFFSAHAQVHWTGAGDDGLWGTPANWSSGAAPSCTLGALPFLDSCEWVLIDEEFATVELNSETASARPGGTQGALFVGVDHESTILIGNEGILHSTHSSIGGYSGNLHSLLNSVPVANDPENGVGRLTVDGGEWRAGGNIRIGDGGLGVLNLKNGGIFTAPTASSASGVTLGFKASGQGMIVIGGAVEALRDADGKLDIANAEISAAETAGAVTGGALTFGAGGGAIVFNHNTEDYAFGSQLISGGTDGALHFVHGTTRLTGNTSQFRGTATVRNGAELVLESVYGAAGSEIRIEDGQLAVSTDKSGDRGGLLRTINGNLILGSGSTTHLGLGLVQDLDSEDPLTSDRIHVTGDLQLGGTLNIGRIGNYGAGVYQIFSFGQTASGTFSSVLFPDDFAGTVEIDNEFNRILLTVGVDLGDVVTWRGGDGIWSAASDQLGWAGWSQDTGLIGEAAWGGQSAVFRSSSEFGVDAGTVTVTSAGGPVEFRGISFLNDGFRIEAEDGAALVAVVGEESTTVGLEVVGGVRADIAAGITGAAGFRKTGDGLLVLSGDNDWQGSTTVAGGELRLGEGGASGNLPGGVAVNGTGTILSFDRSDRHVMAGAITGNGQLHQLGDGTLVLTADNSYGETHVRNGTLQIGDGGSTGSLGTWRNAEGELSKVVVDDGATLAFNRSDSLEVGNPISGAGDVVQRGHEASVITLSGSLADFEGELRTESGRLVINSTDYEGAVSIGDGGVLGGTGVMGSVTIESGGRLAPGNSIGTLTVNGNATFLSGSIFEVEADSQGASDRLIVTGTARLDGNVVALGEGTDWRPRTDYIILEAGTINGEFQGAVEENYAFLDASLEHDHRLGVVTLRLERNDIDFAGVAATPNQAAVGAGLQSLSPAHPLFDRIFGIMETLTPAEAQQAFAAMSGEIHASARNMLLEDSRLVRDTLLDRHYRYGQGDMRSAVWMQVLAHQGEWEGEDVDTLKRDVAGLLLGANYPLGGSAFTFGWAVGYHTNADVELQRIADSGETNNTHIAAMMGYRAESTSWGLRLGIAQTWHEVDIRRHVRFTGYEEQIDTEYDGESLQAFVEFDYPVQLGESMIAPFLGLAWARLETDAFEEADFQTSVGDTVSLKAAAQSDALTTAQIGARGQMQWKGLQLEGALAYRRALSGENPDLRLGFVDGGDSFRIHGASIAKDAMIADLGFTISAGESFTFGAAYNGMLGSDVKDHAIHARLTWALQ